MKIYCIIISVALLAVLSFGSMRSSAQGFNYPVSPVGNTGAGNGRTDPDNLFIRSNPAGMTEIPMEEEEEATGANAVRDKSGWRFQGEGQVIFYRTRRDFTPSGATQEVTSRGTIAPPSFSGEITYTSKDHKYAFGIGTYQIFGFQSKFKDPPEKLGSRAQFFDTKTASNDVAMGGAVQVHKKLSLGASVILGRGFLDVKSPIPQLAVLGFNEQGRLNVSAIGGLGGNFSVNLRPVTRVSLGFSYKTRRRYDLRGELQAVQPVISASGLQFIPVTTDVRVDLKLPAMIEVGTQIRATERLLLAADFRAYDYSNSLKTLDVVERQTGSVVSSQTINAKDVRLIIASGIYKLRDRTKLNFGAAYVTNSFPAAFINPGLFNSGGTSVGVGLNNKFGGKWINFGITGLFGRDRRIDQAQNPFFAGGYSSKGFVANIGVRSNL